VRVCVVDDHEIVREGLRSALPNDPAIDVVGEAASGAEALSLVRRQLPDVVVSDYRLPDMTGEELCRRIRAGFPSTAVVILTTYLSEEVVSRSLDAGAAGFVTKAAGLEELRRVLHGLAEGETPALMGGAPGVVQRLFDAATSQHAEIRSLTPQQERVLELAAAGLTYGEIGEQLSISPSTVRFHIQSLKERVGVKTRTELIAVAIRSALIAPGADATA
jgi:DNA-binding NarL/FixJ family response regulator